MINSNQNISLIKFKKFNLISQKKFIGGDPSAGSPTDTL